MRSARVIVICLLVAACSATGVGPRPLESGFATEAGVADPYADGKRHLAAARYDVAVERFAQALARDRRSLDALNGLAIAHTRLGRFDVAQTYFERALQVDATSVPTLNNYGWSLIEQGRLRAGKRFLELALDHAAEADVPLIAANLESIRRARPSALATAPMGDDRPGAHLGPHRLFRVADDVYRLETIAGPPESATAAHAAPSAARSLRQHASGVVPPAQPPGAHAQPELSVVTEGFTAAGAAPAAVEQFRAAEPERDLPVNTPFGDGPIELWPKPAPESEAGPIPAGD